MKSWTTSSANDQIKRLHFEQSHHQIIDNLY